MNILIMIMNITLEIEISYYLEKHPNPLRNLLMNFGIVN